MVGTVKNEDRLENELLGRGTSSVKVTGKDTADLARVELLSPAFPAVHAFRQGVSINQETNPNSHDVNGKQTDYLSGVNISTAGTFSPLMSFVVIDSHGTSDSIPKRRFDAGW